MTVHTPLQPIRSATLPAAPADSEWAATIARFAAIEARQGDRAFDNACAETSRYYRETIEKGGYWLAPNIARFGDEEIILEWWQGNKKLTLYFSPDGTAEYLASWGTDISADMDEGDARVPGTFRRLWTWLHSK